MKDNEFLLTDTAYLSKCTDGKKQKNTEAKRLGLSKGTGILRHYGSKMFRVRCVKAAMRLSSRAAKRFDRCMEAKKHKGVGCFVEKCFGEACQNRCVTLNLIQGLSMFIKSISIDRCRNCLVARVKRDCNAAAFASPFRPLRAIRKFGMTVSCAKRTPRTRIAKFTSFTKQFHPRPCASELRATAWRQNDKVIADANWRPVNCERAR